MSTWKDQQLNRAKEILAFELTKMVHGEEEAKKAETSARALFAGGGAAENIPTTVLTEADFPEGKLDILALLVKTGLCSSRGDARRNVQQGGVTAGDEKVTDIERSFTPADIGEGLTLRRGKKNYNRVVMGK